MLYDFLYIQTYDYVKCVGSWQFDQNMWEHNVCILIQLNHWVEGGAQDQCKPWV